MAITERYIDVSGSTTWSDSLSTSTPVTLATALTNATAGDRLNIKAGTYTQTANITFATSGTTTSPITFRGVDASWAAIPITRTGDNGPISATLPVISFDSGHSMRFSGSYVVLEALEITTAAYNGAEGALQIATGTNSGCFGCIIANGGTTGTVHGLVMGNFDYAINCDISLTGSGYSTSHVVRNVSFSSRVFYCRITSAGTSHGIYTAGGLIVGNLIYGCGGSGVSQVAQANSLYVLENTIVGMGAAGIIIGTGNTSQIFDFNNRITDCGTYGFFSPDVTTQHISGYSRMDRNTTANSSGGADWSTVTSWALNTTSAIDADEYTDSASQDYSLVADAEGIAEGIFASRDMGALQTAGTGDTIIGGGGGGGGGGSGYTGMVTKGTTSFICHVTVSDSSNGNPKTSLAYSAFAASYMRAGASAITTSTVVNITTLGTFAGSASNTAIKEVSAANAPGMYEIHIPNNALATGSNRVTLMIRDAGTNGFQPVRIELQLVDVNLQDTVRMGLTSLPNEIVGTTDGLVVASQLSTDTVLADAILDRTNAIETGLTPRNALRLIAATTSGAATVGATAVFKSAFSSTKSRLTMDTDTDGNRSNPVTDLT